MTNIRVQRAGVLQRLKASLDRSRLGELMVMRGKITSDDLTTSLSLQKQTNQPLGHILREQGHITRFDLWSALAQQTSTRVLATAVAAFITLSSFAVPKASASSATLRDAPISSKYTNTKLKKNVSMRPRLDRDARQEKIFGSREIASKDISAFTKWTGVMNRLNGTDLPKTLTSMSDASMVDKVHAVNKYVNSFRYIEDRNNWRISDYWATPAEFFARGGDCEDFALAKYAALRSLGVSASDMRLAIVQDQVKNIPHAVLIVYTDEGAMLLDNQIKQAVQTSTVSHYKPIYSINTNGWWRHMS